jgi:flagellar motility protein MotE (MotC chaperone)
MIKLLQSNWATLLVGSALYLGVTGYFLTPARVFPNGVSQPTVDGANTKGASWDFFNPEVDRLIDELGKEKKAVVTREEQLNELSTRLEAERAEINIVLQSMHRMQKDFDRTVVRVREEESLNLKKLAKLYASMSPEGAATIIKQMEDDQIVKFLVFMKEGESAPLLESFAKLGDAEAKRAAAISERLRTAVFRNPTPKP